MEEPMPTSAAWGIAVKGWTSHSDAFGERDDEP